MTTKVVDFLNESGGSKFTENAPRPPVYGEENELQSNGGNSTKSSSSHKSHVSNKSHSSSKSGTSGKGDHSPATTPRKSKLEGVKSGDTLTSHSSLNACEDSEMGAPLGYEPEGSTVNSPPYSENGTPPHLKWAENLHNLLQDSEGVDVFREFMEREHDGGAEELVFWFACLGLKRKIDCDSVDSSIANIQKAIYKRYVRSDKIKCLSKEVKKEIADKVASKTCVDPSIFDGAQAEVENYLREVTYPAFLSSDYYVQYVQNYGDSPKSSQSSGSNSARPISQAGLLPVVHEDIELETKHLNMPAPLPVTTKPPHVGKRMDFSVPSRRTETVKGSMLYYPRNTSSYPAHVSYAPVSAQDSELQSLSSDALTDDALSVTDSSVDGYPSHLRKKHHRKAMKTLAQQNREYRTGLHSQIIPRTEHAPKDCNIAEKNPQLFADLLMDKLNKVFDERATSAKMEEKLRSISEVDKSDEEKLVTSFAKPSSTSSAPFIPLMQSSGIEEEENAESILDQHCSRIWASSNHHTPSYSPGHQSPLHSKSPDRHKDARKKAANGLAVGAASTPGTVGSYSFRTHQRKRDLTSSFSHNNSSTEDRNNMFMCNTETHRHIHHHHHHHHTSRDSSAKKNSVEIEAQTCMTSWRGDSTNIPDFPHPAENAGRGRTSTKRCGGGSANLRKGVDSSSNFDSGISVLDNDSLRVPPNWNNPTGEKVMKWMLESETVQEVSTGTQDTDKSSSSHTKRSSHHRLNQSASAAQQSRQSSKSKSSTRSASMERGGGVLSSWSGGQNPILPSQPFVQDSSMPPPTPPNPTTQLEEAKRRLEPLSRTAAASPIKSKSFTSAPSKEKMRPPVSGLSGSLPPQSRVLPAARTVPSELDTHASTSNTDARVSRRVPASVPAVSQQPSSGDTIIGIYIGQEPIPYRHQLPGRAITLAQIKTLLSKKGPSNKYFFKRDSDEFGDGAGAVFEEIHDDSTIVPMWQGKIVVKVERMDV